MRTKARYAVSLLRNIPVTTRVIAGLVVLSFCAALTALGQAPQAQTPDKQTPDNKAAGTELDALGVPQYTLGETNNLIRLATAQASVSLTAIVTGSDKLTNDVLQKYADTLVLIDKGPLRATAAHGVVEFGKNEFLGRNGANGLTWRIPLQTRDLPLGTAQVRQAQARLGTPPVAVAFEYTVTTKPATAAQWELKGASPVWTLSWHDEPEQRRYQIVVAAQDEPLRNVRLVQSTLHDASGRIIGLERMKLLDGTAQPGTQVKGVDLPPNTLRTILVEIDSPGEYGTFDGQLRFAADGSATLKDVDLKLQASSPRIRLLGIGLTMLGLAVTALTAFLRTKAARVSATRPALVIAESADKLRDELRQVCPACNVIATAIGTLRASVTEAGLDDLRLLPPRVVFATPQSAADMTAALKTHLEKASNRLTGLGVLVREGIRVLVANDPPNRDALIREVEAAAESVQGAADARTTVAAILLKQAEGVEALQEGVFGPVTTVAQADHAISMIAGISWVLSSVISLAIATVWILSDVDYGVSVDLIGSFLWGFGMTTFGAGIQNLTAAGVSTQVNLKLPG